MMLTGTTLHKSPFVFLKRLVIIEFLFAFLPFIVTWLFNLDATYEGTGLATAISFPLLTVIVVTISIIDSLRAFDLVSVMTRGGPYNSSSVLANFMYIEAFNNYKMGYGAAIAVILFLISLVFIFIYLYRTMQTELEY